MMQLKSYPDALTSPVHKPVSPSKRLIRPSFFGLSARNGSVPEIPSFKAPMPANIVNLVPKSTRECTLKIFKVKEKEDKELGVQGDEPVVKKGDAFLDSIRKRDATLKVEFLIDKGKKEYEKKKSHKIVGSMYVNDLWGKQYEVMVKKQARIDWELKKGEFQKRRPMHLKLKEAVGYFEHKNSESARAGEEIKIASVNDRENIRVLTETDDYGILERGAQTDRPLFTEAKEGHYDVKIRLAKKHSTEIPVLPSIRTMQRSSTHDKVNMTRSTAVTARPSIFQDRRQSGHYSKKSEQIFTEGSELRFDKLQWETETGYSTERSEKELTPEVFNRRRSTKQKSLFAGALDNLISLCDSGISQKREIADKLQGAKECWFRDAVDKRKRQDQAKKDHMIEECADSLKKKRERQAANRLSM